MSERQLALMTAKQLLGIKAGANDFISNVAIQEWLYTKWGEDELYRVRDVRVSMVSN